MNRPVRICFVVLFSFFFSQVYSQVSTGYTWSYVTSPAHAAISGGTTLASGTGASMDNAIYQNIPIGFIANFNGIDYTTVGVSTNGFIWFGSTNPAITEYTPISSATAMAGVISGYGCNLKGRVAGATLKYTTTGTCPNRVFTVEWSNMIVTGASTSFGGNRLDLQITITETSNTIDIHPYDSPYFVLSSYFGQVGIRGASNADYKNRSVISCTNNWNTSTTGASNTATCEIDGATCSTFPAANARYRFTNNASVAAVTWIGNINSDWFTASNWSSASVPTTYSNVTIPAGAGNYPNLTGSTNAFCKSLSIAAGASVTTNAGYTGTITIAGNVSNDGTIINSGTNYISLISSSACTISGVGDYTAADLSLSGSCTNYSLGNNITLRKLTIGTGSTLSMNTYNLTVYTSFIQNGTINQSTGVLQIEDVAPTLSNATFNENTGLTYFANGLNTTAANQIVPSVTYYNLKVNTNNGFTAFCGNGSTITCNNFTLINNSTAGGIANAVNVITVNGNFDQAPSGNALVFNLSNNVTISGIMTLYLGIVNTGIYRITMNNSAAASVVAGAGNTDYTLSYINGNLRRLILAGVTGNYDFPLGDAGSSHYLVLMDNGLDGGGFSYIDGYFSALVNHTDASMVATEPSEPGVSYDHISTEGVWFLDPDNQPLLGTYDIKAYINGFSGLIDDQFAVLKRISGSLTGADWENGGAAATRPASMQPGRTLASGYALRYGLSSFSQFGIAREVFTPLPIELLMFKGNVLEQKNKLEWTTVTEINNDYFSVERSADAISFESISIVNGAGNSTQMISYSAFDETPQNGLTYYRLKQTDFNGDHSFSNVIALYREQNEFDIINVFHNPDGSLEVTFNCKEGGLIYYELFDMAGRKILSSSIAVSKDQNKVVIPVIHLSESIYLLKTFTNDKIVTRKIKL